MIQRPKTWSSQAIAACDAALELLGCEIQCISNQTLDLVSLCVFSVYSCSHHVFITLARWIFQVGSRQRQGALPKSWVQNQVRRVRFRSFSCGQCDAPSLPRARPVKATAYDHDLAIKELKREISNHRIVQAVTKHERWESELYKSRDASIHFDSAIPTLNYCKWSGTRIWHKPIAWILQTRPWNVCL